MDRAATRDPADMTIDTESAHTTPETARSGTDGPARARPAASGPVVSGGSSADRPIRFSHRLEAAGLRLATGLMRLLPLDAASWFMGTCWRLVAPLTRRQRRVEAHLALAFPDKSADERRAIALAQWENLGRTFVEALMLDRIAADPSRIALPPAVVDGRPLTDFAANGLVLVSLHAGNWELATLAAMRMGLSPAGVYRPLSNPLSEAVLRREREPYYPGGLFSRREGSALARRIIQRTRAGGATAIVADLREAGGVTVSFFGHPASATPFPAMIARTTGVPVLAGRVIRTQGARFRVEIEPVPIPHTPDKAADIQAGTQAIHDLFERWIRERPEQWFWPHPKWTP